MQILMSRFVVLFLVLATHECIAAPPSVQPEGATLRLYIGTYTTAKNESKGIYLIDMDVKTGKLGSPRIAGEVKNPSFLAIDPKQRFLYAVGELSTFEGKPSGAVTSFAIDEASGKLTRLSQKSSGGVGPCYVSLDAAGRNALVANYGSGGVAALPIDEKGVLADPSSAIQHQGSGPNAKRQTGPHAHSIQLDPAGRYAFAPDLGIDRIMIYRFDGAKGTLTANDPPSAPVAPGSGPRHLAFHPNGLWVFVVNEIASTVTAFTYDTSRGALRELQTLSTLPEGIVDDAYTTADIHVHPNGRFLYVSNRGHDSVSIFSIDKDSARLKLLGHQSTQGKVPRNFNIDPSGRWLIAANQNSDSLVVFRIDATTGLLEPAGITAQVPSPVCVMFLTP